MKCMHCGAVVPEGANFCPVCGDRVAMYKDEVAQAKTPLLSTEEYDANQRQMQPATPQERKRRRNTIGRIVLTSLILIALVLIGLGVSRQKSQSATPFMQWVQGLFGASESTPAPEETTMPDPVQIEGVREEFREKALAFLDEVCSQEAHQKALDIGAKAQEAWIDQVNNEVLDWGKGAQGETESEYAEIVRLLCLYTMSNDYERSMVEENGGRSDAAAEETLAAREKQAAALQREFRDLRTAEAVRTMLAEFP